MVKRESDSISDPVLLPPRKKTRRRTEAYLESKTEHESGLECCRIFEYHLGMTPSHICQGGSHQALPSAPSSQQILKELRTSMHKFEEEHTHYCACLKSDAHEAIQVTKAFHSTFTSVLGGDESSLVTTSMLNIGDESTCALLAKISEYAGVPSHLDLLDWTNLHALLR